MNKYYREVISQREDLKRELQLSQAAWQNYLDKECDFRARWLAGGGSEEGMDRTGCQILLTYWRSKDFLNALKDPDKIAPWDKT